MEENFNPQTSHEQEKELNYIILRLSSVLEHLKIENEALKAERQWLANQLAKEQARLKGERYD